VQLQPRTVPAKPHQAAPPALVDLDAAAQAFAADPALPLDLEHTDVLVAMVCTFRRDRLQPYGQQRPTSPFLQLLADRGALFEHAIVQSPWTRPSTGSLLTGRWPQVLQLDDPGDEGFHNLALAPEFLTIAEAMQRRGYRTIGASGNPNISSTFGFEQGFDAYHEPESLWRDAQQPAPSGAELNAQLLAELDATPTGQRVYLQGFYVDTHTPRRPSREAVRQVQVEGAQSPRRVLNYDASLLTLDAHLAALYLEVKKRRPNLLFVVVGDHGEGLSYPLGHGKGHGNHLYTSTIDVPFLWFHPALPTPGRRIQGLSMGVDLLPTLLGLLGTEPGERVDGVSQAPALLSGRDAAHDVAYSHTWFRRSDKAAAISQGHHLIRDHKVDGEALYRLDEPRQATDLWGQQPALAAALADALDAWLREVSDAAEGTAPHQGKPSDETLEQLETLGYLD
jgi:arylsulfatase A-like enzyme